MNFSDPFGLKPFVQCRQIDGLPAGASHCGIRVVDASRDLDVVIELIPTDGDNKTNRVFWSSAGGPPDDQARRGKYSASGWVEVARPEGMSEQAFDDAVLASAAKQTAAVSGQPYDSDGRVNSNAFVYKSVNGAGGRVPGAASKGKLAPGICGGGGHLSNGKDCSPQ